MPIFRGETAESLWSQEKLGGLWKVPWTPEHRLACEDLQEQAQGSLISIPGSQAFLEKTN